MSVDPDFLRSVQDAGWLIRNVREQEVFGMCPRAGCDVVLEFRAGDNVPATCRPAPEVKEVVVRNFDEVRVHLREKRMRLCLTISETEETAGMAVDYMAKFEKDKPSKIPNAQTFLEWCQVMGIEVVLRDGDLPAQTLSKITQTRHMVKPRRKMHPYHVARRQVLAKKR